MVIRRLVTLFSAVAFLGTSMLAPAHAAMLSSGQYLQSQEREQHMAVINEQLQREEVRDQLTAMGVSPADAEARIARLPDHEIAKMAEEMESMPAGGDVLAVVGIVFIVLLILELTGVINIFRGA